MNKNEKNDDVSTAVSELPIDLLVRDLATEFPILILIVILIGGIIWIGEIIIQKNWRNKK